MNLKSVTLLECHASAVAAEDFDESNYVTRHTTFVLGPDGPIDSDSDPEGAMNIEEGIDIAVVFNYHTVHEEDATEGDSEEPEDSLDVFAAFALEYEYSDPSTEPITEVAVSSVKKFATFNGTLNAWPYWREFLQSTTTRMGLPAVTVETLKIPDLTGRAERARTDSPDAPDPE